jgi:hypothetical protein
MNWTDESVSIEASQWKAGWRYKRVFVLFPQYCTDTRRWHWFEFVYAYQTPFHYDGDWYTEYYVSRKP